jgi:AAA family ATP:ADP antiporter
LFWIAVLTVALNLVNYSGEYVLNRLLVNESILRYGASHAQRVQFMTAFSGEYQTWYNTVALVMQLLLVSRLMRYAGVRACLFILPCISLAGYSSAAALPVLGLVRVLKVAENSVDYSLQNTVNQALFLPTSREAKYKAKAAVDTFCKRFGDLISAGLVFAVSAFGAGLRAMCGVAILLTLVWLWSATRVAKEHRKRTV